MKFAFSERKGGDWFQHINPLKKAERERKYAIPISYTPTQQKLLTSIDEKIAEFLSLNFERILSQIREIEITLKARKPREVCEYNSYIERASTELRLSHIKERKKKIIKELKYLLDFDNEFIEIACKNKIKILRNELKFLIENEIQNSEVELERLDLLMLKRTFERELEHIKKYQRSEHYNS